MVKDEDYHYVVHHADRGWELLAIAVKALAEIASFREGVTVDGTFDEPHAAKIARDALYELPSCGAYEAPDAAFEAQRKAHFG